MEKIKITLNTHVYLMYMKHLDAISRAVNMNNLESVILTELYISRLKKHADIMLKKPDKISLKLRVSEAMALHNHYLITDYIELDFVRLIVGELDKGIQNLTPIINNQLAIG